ncbi:GNAT family N-acetyltransferase [Arthrobacter sp. B1805]|uniref:GNAT family N-acetyltransferase n=1 Tax=Arthrobacter sp. B1805 TaxID=2058892 RepID=UPI000CE40F32|nr:GNAT family N-acetyltransferase [Arthrobacter sp. B1805]
MTPDETLPQESGISTIALRHAPELHRYELVDGDRIAGFTTYRARPRQNQRVFVHTEVHDDYAGQGLAPLLARFALDDVVAQGHRIVAICPFIAAYLRRHPEYRDHVDAPDARPASEPAGTAQP